MGRILLLTAILLIPLVGDVSKRKRSPARISDSKLTSLWEAAGRAFVAGAFVDASQTYSTGIEVARHLRNQRAEASFEMGLANCRLATLQFREASANYDRAIQLATNSGDLDILISAKLNRSTLFRRMGDFRSALFLLQETETLIPSSVAASTNTRIQLLYGVYFQMQGKTAEAIRAFHAGIERASLVGEPIDEAEGWNALGRLHLEQNNLDASEAALTEAFRIKALSRSVDLQGTESYFGLLRLAQNRPSEALQWFDRSIARLTDGAKIPAATLYYNRGQAHLATGDTSTAFSDFAVAADQVRHLRVDVLPSDSVRIGTDVTWHAIYDRFLSTGMRLLRQNGSKALEARLFTAAEKQRALALRDQLRKDREFPAGYWQAMADLQRAETRALNSGKSLQNTEINSLQMRIRDLEAKWGLSDESRTRQSSHQIFESLDSGKSLDDFQKLLEPDEALISFYLGDSESYRWTLTQQTLDTQTLPSRAAITRLAEQFWTFISSGTGDPNSGERLRSALLAQLPPEVAAARHWILVLDGKLFSTPFAALPGLKKGEYLISEHCLRILPSAAILKARQPGLPSGPFVGLGDPIYNTADPRWTGPRPGDNWLRLVKYAQAAELTPTTQFTRLAASGTEIVACARAWNQPSPILLSGVHASRASLDKALRTNPAILHIATHVVTPPESPTRTYIAMGLDSDGQPNYLTSSELASRRHRVGLAVLSGCGSGVGDVLPGAGLFGLTRALLIMGAQSVAASYWPTPDDTGELFLAMYGSLPQSGSLLTTRAAAAALQSAQLKMLRSSGWRAKPNYWAAFFIIGKD